eukprot:gene10620-11564_t
MKQYQDIIKQNEKYHQMIERYLLSGSSSDNIGLSELHVLRSQLKERIKEQEEKKQELLQQANLTDIVQAKLAEEKITLQHNLQLKQQKQQRLTLLTELNKDLQKMLTLRAEKLLLSRIKQALRVFDAVKIETPNLPSHREKKSEVKVVGYSSIMNIPFPNYAIFDGMPIDLISIGLLHLIQLIESFSTLFNLPLPHMIFNKEAYSHPTIILQHDHSKHYSLLPVHVLRKSRLKYCEFRFRPMTEKFSSHSKSSERKRTSSNDIPTTKLSHTEKTQDDPRKESASGRKASNDGKEKKKTHVPSRGGESNSEEDDEEYLPNPDFYSVALPALQENVLAICSYFGLSEDVLFPSCAMLWNLQLLHLYLKAVYKKHARDLLVIEDSSSPSLWTNYTLMIDNLSTSKARSEEINCSNGLGLLDNADVMRSELMKDYVEDLRCQMFHRFSRRNSLESHQVLKNYQEKKAAILSADRLSSQSSLYDQTEVIEEVHAGEEFTVLRRGSTRPIVLMERIPDEWDFIDKEEDS